MSKRSYNDGKPALDLVEEAAHELRHTPARLWVAYYAGTVPFVLGLLYFWSDMSYGALAERHCAALALGLTGLFVWMKCWQTVFVSGIRDRLAGQTPPPWTVRRAGRVALVQAVVQPAKLLLLPLALATGLVFPWALAFYESISVMGNGVEPVALRGLLRRAARQAGLWPGQNFTLTLILSLLGGILWLNSMIAVAILPALLKLLLGVETVFTQSGRAAMFNTTFFATTAALAGLALDPLVKMIYTLRSFYGEARRDGVDLLAELGLVRRRAGLLAAMMLGLTLWHPLTTAADFAPAAVVAPVAADAEPPPAATPAELEQALKTTLSEDKYTWRLPRESVPETSARAGWFHAFFQSLGQTLWNWAHAIFEWLRDLHRWFNKLFKHDQPEPDEPVKKGAAWLAGLRVMAYVLIFLALGALALLLWRYGRQAWTQRALVTAETLPAPPDLTDENVTASQLPEDEWLRLARELAAKGDWRLALRALYLATLAHLASRDLVSIARFKSNRDYQLEVARRARAKPELRQAFEENVAMFDCAWYGLYAVSGEGFRQFQANLERIRAC